MNTRRSTTALIARKYRFSYFKKDGSIREAVGTLDPALIPEDKRPQNNPPVLLEGVGGRPMRDPSPAAFSYYDLLADGDTGAWRSFRLDNFIGFVEEVK